ncbi:D-sedoheptulose-7-phosphate isomerase [Haliea sp. E17]|uniref:D-sedoheptulose-7-phosphate isomerase n=1 Tax=Haliea sp. E17 TaxID=3401576 RepID=UPI003AACF876
MDYYEIIAERFQGTIEHIAMSVDQIAGPLTRGSDLVCQSLLEDRKLLCCGAGAGAALGQLFVAGMLSRLDQERPPLPAICLNADSAALCAITGDSGPGHAYGRQIHALAQEGDVLLVISSGGNNPSLEQAVAAARERNMRLVALSNDADSALPELLGPGDVLIEVDGHSRSRIIELQVMCLNLLSQLIEYGIFGSYSQD